MDTNDAVRDITDISDMEDIEIIHSMMDGFTSWDEKLAFYTIDKPPLTWSTSAVYNRDCILSLPAQEFIRITKHVVQHKQKMREQGHA